MPRLVFPALIALFAFTCTIRALAVDDAYRARRQHDKGHDFLKSPGPVVLDLVTFEHPHGWADVIWLEMVQEMGKGFKAQASDWNRVERGSDLATDLDPNYFTVYHSAGVCLSVWGGRVEASDKILQKGWDRLPNRWELPFLRAYNAYFLRDDPADGADLMDRAGRIPGVPRYVVALAGRMRFHSGDEQGAIEYLELMLEHADEAMKPNIQDRLGQLRSEQRLRLFDDACKRFREQHGRMPKDGEEIRASGLIEAAPIDAYGEPILFRDDCVAHTARVPLREAEAQERRKAKKSSYMPSVVQPDGKPLEIDR